MNLEKLRLEIDEVDRQIVKLMEKRLEISREIAIYKRENHLDICDAERECVKKNGLERMSDVDKWEFNKPIFEEMIEASKRFQGVQEE